jgi:hypothetical protein
MGSHRIWRHNEFSWRWLWIVSRKIIKYCCLPYGEYGKVALTEVVLRMRHREGTNDNIPTTLTTQTSLISIYIRRHSLSQENHDLFTVA